MSQGTYLSCGPVIKKTLLLLSIIAGRCVAAKYGQISLPFEQSDLPGAFVSRGSGFNLVLSKDGAAFTLLGGKPAAVIYMRVVGSNPAAQVTGQEELNSRANYLIGRNPNTWRTNVKQFGSVRLREVLPNTDIVFYGVPGELEYDLVLRPGADVNSIRLRFEGAGLCATQFTAQDCGG